jgi:hypothetical protein
VRRIFRNADVGNIRFNHYNPEDSQLGGLPYGLSRSGDIRVSVERQTSYGEVGRVAWNVPAAKCSHPLNWEEGGIPLWSSPGASGILSRTSSITILLRVATLNDALLLVLELLRPRHGCISGAGPRAGAIARISSASRVIRRRWTGTVTAVHHRVSSQAGVTGFVCRIRKIKETWSGCRGKSTGSLPLARCLEPD